MTTIAEVLASIATVQTALQVINSLSPTAYMFQPQATVQNLTTFDYVIVGAGTAGSVLANRLTENGTYNVLLIEAGGELPLETTMPGLVIYVPRSDADWKYQSVADSLSASYHINQTHTLPAGKMLSGSSGVTFMFHSRGGKHDFDSWATELNDSTWNYESVLPYFIKSETVDDEEILASDTGSIHGTNGLQGISRQLNEEAHNYLAAFEEMGNKIVADVDGDVNVGYLQPFYEIYNSTRSSTAVSYLTPVKSRTNLYILKNTLATKILFDDNNNAIGIKVQSSNGNINIFYASKEVIISAGTFKSPQLLMLSGVGPKSHLESLNIDVVTDLPVGKNLQDLYGVMMAHKMKESNATASAQPPSMFPLPLVVGLASLNESQTYPDYLTENFVVQHDTVAGGVLCSHILGFVDDICQSILDAGVGRDILFSLIVNLNPASRGEILLKSTDPTDAPLIDMGYLTNSTDLERLTDYVMEYRKVVNSTYFKSVGAEWVKFNISECDSYNVESEDYWKCYSQRMLTSVLKYSSSCAMGSVLDSRFRVKNVNRLRVIDASAMPKILRAYPSNNVKMMAEKGADFIIADAN